MRWNYYETKSAGAGLVKRNFRKSQIWVWGRKYVLVDSKENWNGMKQWLSWNRSHDPAQGKNGWGRGTVKHVLLELLLSYPGWEGMCTPCPLTLKCSNWTNTHDTKLNQGITDVILAELVFFLKHTYLKKIIKSEFFYLNYMLLSAMK